MFPKGLIVAILAGMAAGAIVGVLLVTQKNDAQLEFVDGYSLSIITQKKDFELGEPISITIINSGTHPLTFSDASYGLEITGLDGRVLYTPISAQVISILEPKEQVTLEWDQKKNDGDFATAGTYKITSSTIENKSSIKKSTTINIHR